VLIEISLETESESFFAAGIWASTIGSSTNILTDDFLGIGLKPIMSARSCLFMHKCIKKGLFMLLAKERDNLMLLSEPPFLSKTRISTTPKLTRLFLMDFFFCLLAA